MKKKIIKGYFFQDGARVSFEFYGLNKITLCFKKRKILLKKWLSEKTDTSRKEKDGEEYEILFDKDDGQKKSWLKKEITKCMTAFDDLLQDLRNIWENHEEVREEIQHRLEEMQKEEDDREICVDLSNFGKINFSYPAPIKRIKC